VIVGALALVWPAFVNGYPLLFSDTGAFLFQALGPFMIWDKPWVYGPFLYVLHARTTLWLPLLAQGLLLSHTLWLLAAAFGRATAMRHVVLCAVLAGATAAGWSTGLLMPDFLAPVVVIALFLLGCAEDRLSGPERWWLYALATFAIAAHLAHLVIAAGCIGAILLLAGGWRRPVHAAGPLLAALAVLAVTNLVGHGHAAISPYGSVFLLARLGADGIVESTLQDHCPAAGWRLCDWRGRLPTDSDEFMWKPDGPVFATPGGPIALAPEAGAIVATTLAEHPGAVARAALRNTLHQLIRVDIGDTLGPNALDVTVGLRLRQYFPMAEQARYVAAQQVSGTIAALARPFVGLHRAVLVLAALATLGVAAGAARRGDRRLGAFAMCVMVGLLANAFATGALSGPHDRYQARIAWLLLLPPAMALAKPAPAGQATRARTVSGDMRTSAS